MSQPMRMNTFSGIVPKLPATLLPGDAATVAQNCDFGYGELRNTNDGVQLSTLSNAAQSIYTEDGLLFFSWPSDVNAARSPIAADPYNRLYYSNGSDFRVASRDLMTTTGGVPAASYRVGVPRPTVAPVLAATPAPDPTTGTTFTAQFFYESGGVKYQEQAVTLTQVTVGKEWTFPLPSAQSSTPAGANPQIELTGKNSGGTTTFDIYTQTSTFTGTSANAADWTLSLTAPTSGNTYTLDLTASAQQGANQQTVAFCYTYVNLYGEEGPPSDPTLVTHEIGLEIDVTVKLDTFSADYCPISSIRIYKTPEGSSVANYFYSGSVPILALGGGPTWVFQDTTPSSSLAEQLASTGYYAPPANLVGVMALPNGILAGWVDNALYFCVAYKPWAWNPAFELTFPNRIVGAMPMGSGMVLNTTAQPYVVSGTTPDAMTAAPLNISQAGISKWAIANVNGQVMYASHEGIVVVVGVMGSLAYSDRFFTRDVWKTKFGAGFATMRFANWDGRLVVYSTNNAFTPFMLRFDETGGTMTELPNFAPACTFISPITDGLYYVIGTNAYQFNGGNPLTANWMSREAVLPGTANFGVAQVIATGTWTVSLYTVDDDPATGNMVTTLRYQRTVTGSKNFKLPSGFRSRRFQLGVSGTGRFQEFRMADTFRTLAVI
jgi:hypothetical protein